MKRELDAIFDGQVFRPDAPVDDLARGTRVRLSVSHPDDADGQTKPAVETDRLTQIAALSRATFSALTEPEEAAMRAARLDQQHFFDHSHS